MISENEIIELIKKGYSYIDIKRQFNIDYLVYDSALRKLIKKDNIEEIISKLASNLPESVFFRGELEKLYHALTKLYIPSSYSISKVIERIYMEGNRNILLKILKAMAMDLGIKYYERMIEAYPSLEKDFKRRMEELIKVIREIDDLSIS